MRRPSRPTRTFTWPPSMREDKSFGFFRTNLAGGGLETLLDEEKRFRFLAKAEEADRILFVREDYDEFPDLWVGDLDFGSSRKVTDVNPGLMDRFAWGTSELVEWTSDDGVPLQGVVIKPGNYEPGKRYPVLTYFYRFFSQRLHEFNAPAGQPSAELPHLRLRRVCRFPSRRPLRGGAAWDLFPEECGAWTEEARGDGARRPGCPGASRPLLEWVHHGLHRHPNQHLRRRGSWGSGIEHDQRLRWNPVGDRAGQAIPVRGGAEPACPGACGKPDRSTSRIHPSSMPTGSKPPWS